MKALLSLNPYFFRYKYQLLLGILFVVLSNLFAIYPAQMVRVSFDLVAEKITEYQKLQAGNERALFYSVFESVVLRYGLLIVAMALLRGLFLFFMRQTIIVMSRHIEYDQKNDIYAQYQRLPLRFYRKNNTGDLMARISEDVGRVRMYTGPAIMYGINLLVLFVMVISYMISVNAEFAFFVLLPLPVLSLLVYLLNHQIEKRSDQIQKSLSRLSTVVQEAFSGIRVIKAFGKEKDSLRIFSNESDHYRNQSVALGNINAWFSPLIMTLVGASSIITVYVGGLHVMEGKISTGNIAEFLIYVNMLTWPVTSLGWVMSIAQRAAVSQVRINEFLNEKNDIVSVQNLDVSIKGKIEFQKVGFIYPDTEIEALQDISFVIHPGESIGILGHTGSGKSTLANLVCRLFDAGKGKILIDDRPIEDYNPEALRRQMGYVPQDVFLFSDTIASNIRFGNPGAGNDALEKAGIQAHLTESIERFEHKYETLIGERGITLSGGQKQRLAIARALILQPRILILDDCLSAVDTNTENIILNHLKEEMQGKTTLIISHRISSVKMADHILVLDNGSIIQKGSHESLMAVPGVYKELYERQLVTAEEE